MALHCRLSLCILLQRRTCDKRPSPCGLYHAEDVEIDLAAGTIQMVGKLGPLCNRFQGRCRFEAEPATGAYNMVFG